MTSVPLGAGGTGVSRASGGGSERLARAPGRGLRVLAVAAAAATYLLIVAGGVVRVSGSGLGCGIKGQDWPLCHGRLVPPADLATVIEFSHRMLATLSTILVVALAVVAWSRYRRLRRITLPVTAVVVLLVVQILLGAVTVELRLPGEIVLVHLANALLLLGVLLYAAVQTFAVPGPGEPAALDPSRATAVRRLTWAAGATYLLVLSGALVVANGAGWACAGWPLCGNGFQLDGGTLAGYNLFHRLVAGVVGLLLFLAVHAVMRAFRGVRPVRIASLLVMLLLLAQVAAGAVLVELRLRSATRGIHLALASALWGVTAVLTFLVRPGVLRTSPSGGPAGTPSAAAEETVVVGSRVPEGAAR
ncbi:MAG TPA: COX15/CtaA family protein [Candidatus Dormibacteraeota bacterium]|nr:COX15/CtaA family protein [Candidatus Dormibacteraeota bacterium]